MNNRIEYIDKAKGIGILCVVFLHIALTKDFWGYTFWGGWIRTFFMPLFFVTSGIFFHQGNLVSKVRRLLIPFFSFNLIALCFYSGRDLFRGQTIDATGIILGMIGFSCPHDPPLWFLISLVEILVFAHFLIKTMNSSYAITVSLLVGIAGYLISSRFEEMPFYIIPSLMCLPHFVMGYYMKERILGLKTKYLLFALLASVCLFILKPVIPTLSDGIIPQGYILFSVCSFLGSLGVYGICRFIKGYVGSSLDYFGRNSLIVLSTHWILLPIPYRLLNVTNNSVLSVFTGFAIILLLEVAIVYFINHKMSFLLGK